jgi:riboflavin kinase/FMN adenylyltransferase
MNIIRSLEALHASPQSTALAIGNFDGLHLGHQKILKSLVKEAEKRRLPSSVLTFSPHPERAFGPKKILMLQTLEQRLEGISRFGVDLTLVAPFTKEFSALSPEKFIRQILSDAFRAKVVVIGTDFRFGKNREGDIRLLSRLGAKYGCQACPVPPIRRRGAVVSSSLIRDLVAQGQIGRANELLGRPYAIEGDVVKGARRGTQLGFPTANIETPNEISPPGVFVTLLEIISGADSGATDSGDTDTHSGDTVESGDMSRIKKFGTWPPPACPQLWPSITNVGVRPTFKSGNTFHSGDTYRIQKFGTCPPAHPCPPLAIETHVLDFRENIRGRSVRIRFLKKIREEKIFGSADELIRQIREDEKAARLYFSKHL